MLSSITPLGERGHGRRWHVTASWYAAGSTLGGGGVGWLAGLLGSFAGLSTGVAVTLAAAAVCIAAAGADVFVGGRSLPSWRRQVNENWLVGYRAWVVGGGFGVQLGAGLVTIVTSASTYAVFALAGLTTTAVTGGVVGATFGLARALPVLATRPATTPVALGRLHAVLAAWARPARIATVTVLALGGTVLLSLGGH